MNEPLPLGWIQTTLGEVTRQRRIKIDPKSYNEIPFVGLEHVESDTGRIIEHGSTSGLRSSTAVFGPGDLLYGRLRPYLNKVTIPDFTGVASSEFIVFEETPYLKQRYLQLLLMTPRFTEYATQMSTGDRPRISFDAISRFSFGLPPLAEQERILDCASSYLARIRNAESRLTSVSASLAHYRDRLVGEFFADSNHDSSWEPRTVADVSTAVFDGPFGSNLKSRDYSESGARVIRLENIGRLQFINEKATFVTLEKASRLKRHSLQADDILFSSFVSEQLRVCLYPGLDELGAINKADCFVVRCDRAICEPSFLMYHLSTTATYQALVDSVHGATRPRISLSQMKAIMLRIPPLAVQRKIVAGCESALGSVEELDRILSNSLQGLTDLKRRVWQEAVDGNLSVSYPDDEAVQINSTERTANKAELLQQLSLKERVVSGSTLLGVLRKASGWLPAQVAFERCGLEHGSETDFIEDIYSQLRQHLAEGKIELQTVRDKTGTKLYDELRAR